MDTLDELSLSVTTVRSLRRLDKDRQETHCAFCGRRWPANGAGNGSGNGPQISLGALASGGTVQAVWLPDPRTPCSVFPEKVGFSQSFFHFFFRFMPNVILHKLKYSGFVRSKKSCSERPLTQDQKSSLLGQYSDSLLFI